MRRASRKIWENNWDVFKVGPSILFSKSAHVWAWSARAGTLGFFGFGFCTFRWLWKGIWMQFPELHIQLQKPWTSGLIPVLQFPFVLQKLQGETSRLGWTKSCRATSLAHASQSRSVGCSGSMPVYVRCQFVQFVSCFVALVWVSLYPQSNVF